MSAPAEHEGLVLPCYAPFGARTDTAQGAEIPSLTRQLRLAAGVRYDVRTRFILFAAVDPGQTVSVASFIASEAGRTIGPWRSQRGAPFAVFEDLGETPAFRGVAGDGQPVRVGVAIKISHGALIGLSAQALGTTVDRLPEDG